MRVGVPGREAGRPCDCEPCKGKRLVAEAKRTGSERQSLKRVR